MDKILVEVRCPATAKNYDFRISKKLNAKDGLAKIADEIRNIEKNPLLLQHNCVLFDGKNGRLLNEKMTFSENGICGGDCLMII